MGSAYNPVDWSALFSAEAGASAALAGLIFVAVSINLASIIKRANLVARSAEALFILTGVFLTSTLCLAPAQAPATLGWELTVVGAAIWAAATSAQLRSAHKNPFVRGPVKLLNFLLTQCAVLPAVAGGISMIAGRGGGLYWLLDGVVFSLIASLFDAWVLLIEILR
jgi:modulator of FtsH protease